MRVKKMGWEARGVHFYGERKGGYLRFSYLRFTILGKSMYLRFSYLRFTIYLTKQRLSTSS